MADSIQIRVRDVGRLMTLRPYSLERVAKIKAVVGRRWHQQEQRWTVLQMNEAVTHVLEVGYLSAYAVHGTGRRHSHGPGVARAQGRKNDDVLHPRAQPWRPWC